MDLKKYKDKKISALTGSINQNTNTLQSFVGLYSSDCRTLIKDNVVAIWDTGATCCVVDEELAEKVGLISISKKQINTVGGSIISDVFSLGP
jgi:predicted aspartyl protease